jgi:uncharacterized protein YkwD
MRINKYPFILIIPVIIFFSYSRPVHAFDLSYIFGGLGRTVGAIAGGFDKIKTDFCQNYYSGTTKGEWTTDEFRTKLGENMCGKNIPTENKVVKYDNTEEKTSSPIISTTTQKTPIFSTKPISTSTINVKKPVIKDKDVPKDGVSTPAPLVGDTSSVGLNLGNPQIIYWTNIDRTKTPGLSALAENDTLDSIARERVDDMFNKGYFEHISPTGDSAVNEAGILNYKYLAIGENIALGNFESARTLLDAWMASPGHRENIENVNYTEIGVAAKEGMYAGQKTWIAAQIFGRPLSSCTEPNINIKSTIQSYYSATQSMGNQAQIINSELISLKSAGNLATYNQKIPEYNSLLDAINSLTKKTQSMVNDYNVEVNTYNDCIKLK